MSKWKQRQPKIRYHPNDSILDKLLKIRGIEDKEQFLNPGKDVLHDPYQIHNIDVIADRIIEAVNNKKLIGISTDPDNDGLQSTSILYRYLRNLDANVYFMYHERSKGHSVEYQLNQIKPETNLLIVLDSSTNEIEACKRIKDMNIDLIIVDHHLKEVDNPHALIANIQMDDYPNKHISTSGLMFKLCSVLDEKLNINESKNYLDMVASGIYSDVMRIDIPENRYLVIQGMRNIKNPGLSAILKVENIDVKNVDSNVLGFSFGSLINGAARMENIKKALDLLLTDDEDEAIKIVKELKKLKSERQKAENELTNKYLETVKDKDKFIIVYDEEASKNFNGLVAQKLAQKFKRPALVMRNWKGELKGSFRSYADFNVKDFLSESGIVEYSLGHKFAGGIGLSFNKLDKLKQYINNNVTDNQFESIIEYDLELDSSDITFDLIEQVNEFNYLTGNGFPKATFKINNLFVEDDPKVLGKFKDTVKIVCDNLVLMKFKTSESYVDEIEVFDEISAVGELNINEWMNPRTRETRKTKQLFLHDFKVN